MRKAEPGSAAIYRDLRRRLVASEFPPAQRMRSAHMRTEYGVAASTMREVFFRLASEGFLDFEDQKGFRVPKMDVAILHDLTVMRLLLEKEGARLSLDRGDLEWEARLAAAHHKLAHLEQRLRDRSAVRTDPELGDIWNAAEYGFHDTLMSACGSQMLRDTHRRFYDRFRQFVVQRDGNAGFLEQNIAQHKAILDAALARDQAATAAAIHDHLAHNLIADPGTPEPVA
ncbi:GntR family transcriptional regulator [Oceanomicrobium pacificus]|nr:GntR family transcriptional regulator [Oceanomicrobium pacificus]